MKNFCVKWKISHAIIPVFCLALSPASVFLLNWGFIRDRCWEEACVHEKHWHGSWWVNIHAETRSSSGNNPIKNFSRQYFILWQFVAAILLSVTESFDTFLLIFICFSIFYLSRHTKKIQQFMLQDVQFQLQLWLFHTSDTGDSFHSSHTEKENTSIAFRGFFLQKEIWWSLRAFCSRRISRESRFCRASADFLKLDLWKSPHFCHRRVFGWICCQQNNEDLFTSEAGGQCWIISCCLHSSVREHQGSKRENYHNNLPNKETDGYKPVDIIVLLLSFWYL